MSDPINIQELVEKYIRVRDRKAEITNAAKAEAAKLDRALELAEAAILKFFNDNGMDSASANGMTAYKSTRTSATVADWDATLEWIKVNAAWHMLERRVSKTAVQEFIDAEGDLPPGVNWKSDITINVRRS